MISSPIQFGNVSLNINECATAFTCIIAAVVILIVFLLATSAIAGVLRACGCHPPILQAFQEFMDNIKFSIRLLVHLARGSASE